jgi:hypothetical protein
VNKSAVDQLAYAFKGFPNIKKAKLAKVLGSITNIFFLKVAPN